MCIELQTMMLSSIRSLLVVGSLLVPVALPAQQQLELFEIRNNDLYWSNTYIYKGNADSLRREVVQMLKSKFYTFNVTRNETGYNGEIKHYTVDCKRYGRRYASTPGIYWEGEWSGKFIVEITDDAYRVTVYALYAEKMEKSPPYHRMDKIVGGRFIDKVTTNDRSRFRKSEHPNITLMSASLKDQFDISRTVLPQGTD
jgi:hypothetical protein